MSQIEELLNRRLQRASANFKKGCNVAWMFFGGSSKAFRLFKDVCRLKKLRKNRR